VRLLTGILFCLLTVGVFAQDQEYVTSNKTLKLMGTRFDITVVANNHDIGQINIDEATAEIRRIEALISSWNPDSETSLINKNAGIRPVKVSFEIFQLIQRAKQISELTDGAFDISYASIEEIWKFDGSMKRLLISKQVVGGIINAAGDLTTWGTKADGEKWLIGIANPLSKEKIFSWLPIVESSVATSGNYEKFVVFDGIKYSHIIDPRTGIPSTGVNSVSVFHKDAEFCDALATAVFIMGKEAGLFLINQLPLTEVILVDSDNKVHKSSGILFESEPKS